MVKNTRVATDEVRERNRGYWKKRSEDPSFREKNAVRLRKYRNDKKLPHNSEKIVFPSLKKKWYV